jgi:ribonuclease-3
MEYLGDAVLSSIVADYLYKKFPHQHEGFLTEMRSRIVSRSRFNKLSLKMGLNKLIFQGNGSFSSSKSIYGDTFEAMIGAIYLDRGYNFTKKIVNRRIIEGHLDVDEIEKTDTNFKSRILEYAQREKRQLEFKVVQELGEGHRKQYLVELLIDNASISRGQDFSIKAAEQIAAQKACEELLED